MKKWIILLVAGTLPISGFGCSTIKRILGIEETGKLRIYAADTASSKTAGPLKGEAFPQLAPVVVNNATFSIDEISLSQSDISSLDGETYTKVAGDYTFELEECRPNAKFLGEVEVKAGSYKTIKIVFGKAILYLSSGKEVNTGSFTFILDCLADVEPNETLILTIDFHSGGWGEEYLRFTANIEVSVL